MAKSSLNELLRLVKQQTELQEKLQHQLLKAENLMAFSRQEIQNQLNALPTVLAHLPQDKQHELTTIVKLLCEYPEVGMVILFGSYARGDWVEEYEDDGIHLKYQSDFDILVIVSDTCKASEQKKLEHALFKAMDNLSILYTPVSILVHDIHFLNCHLKKAQYFFSDIQKEGLTLYDSGQLTLAKAVDMDHKERYQLAKEDFEYYFENAKNLMLGFQLYLDRGNYREAAFDLHQITERLYTCILLVFTRYKPKTHKLDILRKLTHALDKRFIKIFPLTTPEDLHRFTLLCEAYVDARYKKTYIITLEELSELAEKVQELTQLTENVCHEKIKNFLENSEKPLEP